MSADWSWGTSRPWVPDYTLTVRRQARCAYSTDGHRFPNSDGTGECAECGLTIQPKETT